jgi:GNAT superfamily N-acetyltransferase
MAEMADIQRLAHLLARFELECGFALDTDPEWALTEAGANHIQQALSEEDGIALAATCDEEVVGFLGGGIRQEKRGPVGGLEGLFVLPAFRRKGVGTRLVACFLQWCERQNLDQVSVAVAPANDAAIALYETMGFGASTLILERCV